MKLGAFPPRRGIELIKSSKMKLTLQYHNVRSTGGIEALVENMILSLQPAMKIDHAIVRLEEAVESSPRFRTSVHLVTPGPDVIAEGRDHTLLAAINKVISALKNKIGHRVLKRLRRMKRDAAPKARHAIASIN